MRMVRAWSAMARAVSYTHLIQMGLVSFPIIEILQVLIHNDAAIKMPVSYTHLIQA